MRPSIGVRMASGRVLVTGAAGLIGGAVCRRLAGKGVQFTAVWHVAELAVLGNSDAIRADLAQSDSLSGLDSVRAVVHAAAVLPSSFEDSERVAALNRRIDDLVLERARAWRAPVVYISTAALYGRSMEGPIDESAEIAPTGGYLEEKARTEVVGFERAEALGVPFTALRVNAPYGPGQRAPTVIQRFVERAIAGETLEYYGTGAREQDFTWADDIADAVALALTGPGGTFNVATGRPVTMRALAETVARTAGLPASAVGPAGREDPQEASKARFDVSAAARTLGWTATTPLDAGIAMLLRAAR